MREVGYSHFGQIGHPLWLCVPCKLEMHGTKEIDYHLEIVHGYNLSEWGKMRELFHSKQIESRPNCNYLIEDCRGNRGVKIIKGKIVIIPSSDKGVKE